MIRLTTLSRLLVAVLPWFLLTACVQPSSPAPQQAEVPDALFTDSDVDKAGLEVASGSQLRANVEGNLFVAEKKLATISSPESNLGAQAVLPDTSGFVYYIQHDPNSQTEPFSLFRIDQQTEVSTKVYGGKREIQSVAGSGDGKIITLSMRESTNPSSDFEIFRFLITTLVTQRFTGNAVNDSNVSMSSDALRVVWERPVSSKATLILRSYASDATTTNFTESVLNRDETQRQPSLSSNGRFIVFIRAVGAGQVSVFRLDLATGEYEAMFGPSFLPLESPSISNTGQRILWHRNEVRDEAILRDLDANTTQTVIGNQADLEHPFLSADGQFVTFGQSENGAIKVFTKNLQTNAELRITDPVSPVNHTGMTWQMPFTKQQKVILFGESSEPFSEIFGSSVAMNGSLMVVAEPFDGNHKGSAYLLSHNALGVWNVFKKLSTSDGTDFDFFGSAVAISGDTVVVGASFKRGRTEEAMGAAYIFERNQGGLNSWGEVKKLVASDGSPFTNFGNAVAISGDIVAVGTQSAEQVYLFARNQGGPNNWGQIKILSNRARNGLQFFGRALALSEDTLVVGAHLKNVAAGAAYIFQKDQGGTDNWGEVKTLSASDGEADDFFGFSVAISGDTLVVGAPFENHDTNKDGIDEIDVGAAYLFERNQGGTNAWGEVKKLLASDGAGARENKVFQGDLFGSALTISGDVVVIGASFENHDTNHDGKEEFEVGAAYLFERNQGGANTWGELEKLVAADGAERDGYGGAVAISGKVVAVGAPRHDNGNNISDGAVYIDER
jgi:FG-GAP repeat